MNYVQLGKEISYVLRYHPEKYNLHIDNEGWINVDNLLNVLGSRYGLLKKTLLHLCSSLIKKDMN